MVQLSVYNGWFICCSFFYAFATDTMHTISVENVCSKFEMSSKIRKTDMRVESAHDLQMRESVRLRSEAPIRLVNVFGTHSIKKFVVNTIY